ncbi:hypothetical protein DIPPA_17018 [Diplonema papillatum]|nr:hypothetical protein DIPPA_17018 [Diplonema papillatum]
MNGLVAAKRPPPTPGTGERPALKKRVLGTPKESPIAGRKRKKAKATTPESGLEGQQIEEQNQEEELQQDGQQLEGQ